MKRPKQIPVARRIVKLPINHIWEDGPHGRDYHCAICRISRVENWNGTTCLSEMRYRMEQAGIKP